MARIRSIHPGIWTDERFVSVSRDARLLLIGLLNECDDQGAFAWKPLQIKMRVLAGDAVDVATIGAWLSELGAVDLIRSYEVGGSRYGAVRNFRRWQNPKKPNSTYPMPDELQQYVGTRRKGSEPGEDDGGGGSEPDAPPSAAGSEPVRNSGGNGSEKSAQREDGGGRESGRKEDSDLRSDAEAASLTKPPPDVRAELWHEGTDLFRGLTGKSTDAAKRQIGKFLKDAGNDCAKVLGALREARDQRPIDPTAWITAALQARKEPRNGFLGLIRDEGIGQAVDPVTAFLERPNVH